MRELIKFTGMVTVFNLIALVFACGQELKHADLVTPPEFNQGFIPDHAKDGTKDKIRDRLITANPSYDKTTLAKAIKDSEELAVLSKRTALAGGGYIISPMTKGVDVVDYIIVIDEAMESQEVAPAGNVNAAQVSGNRSKVQEFAKPNVTSSQSPELPGTVSPTAKQLVFKSTYPSIDEFHDGLAVLRDGSLTGVINEKGDLVVPYGKYSWIAAPANGYVPVTDPSRKSGLLNSKGEVVVPLSNGDITSVDEEGFFRIGMVSGLGGEARNIKGGVYKFKSNERFTRNDTAFSISYSYSYVFTNGLCKMTVQSLMGTKSGFVNRQGVTVIKPEFDEVEEFSEGLAAVSKRNAVGETKWGFVDVKGQLVIGFDFSNKPGPFLNGLSHVKSKNQEHGWIDKGGNIKFKMSDFPGWYSPSNFDFRNPKIRVSGRDRKYGWLNMNGTIEPAEISYTRTRDGKIENRSLGNFTVEKTIKDQMLIRADQGVGILDGQGNVIIPPIFQELSFLDPKSGLAKASISNGREKTEGYVDKRGVFVIIKGKPSEW